ncbi:uncharacterized protein LOC141660192 [Apium graveolens]|uniref:uncharacterized protein LOC141660192 n=1 Tax=Apium graveolens TaxID=4045 RepID=UPI003D7BA5D2
MKSGSNFSELGDVQNGEHFSTSSISASGQSTTKRKRLTNSNKSDIVHMLSLDFNNNKLKSGSINTIVTDYGVSRITISKIWKDVGQAIKDGKELPNVDRKFKGGNMKYIFNLEKVRSIPLHLRTNIRTLACQLKVGKSTVHRMIQKDRIKSHSNALKPYLTPLNMQARVIFCLKHIESSTLRTNPTYIGMFSIVHIDEKWFYMTRTSQKYYLLPNEPEPHRTCKSKIFITKVMFMSAVARSRFDKNGNCIFDGKIGIFSFTKEEAAVRTSKNRAKGVMELKPIENINKVMVKQCIIEKILPAIKEKWPQENNKHIIIQQDNASSHINGDDIEFMDAAKSDGFNVTLTNQPANSPDLNINDLGFFRIIQGLQHEKAPKTVRELVDAVNEAYKEVEPSTLNYVWLSLQNCMTDILKNGGNKNYKLPHIGKKRLERLGQLPSQMTAPLDVVEKALNGTT